MAMLEKTIEQHLVRTVRAHGGLAPKFISPGWDGVPDRLVLLPGGRMCFVETKAPGKKFRPLQEYRKHQLEHLGFRVYVMDSLEQAEEIVMETGRGDIEGDNKPRAC